MIQSMKWSRSLRKAVAQIESQMESSIEGNKKSGASLVRTVGWVSAGITALALGVVVGREIRQRYKFNRRTPYDFYAHSGDQATDVEFGVGI
jgi:hypothetical protein